MARSQSSYGPSASCSSLGGEAAARFCACSLCPGCGLRGTGAGWRPPPMSRREAGEPNRLQPRLQLPKPLIFLSAQTLCPDRSRAVIDGMLPPPRSFLLARPSATFLPSRLRPCARPAQGARQDAGGGTRLGGLTPGRCLCAGLHGALCWACCAAPALWRASPCG